MATVVGHDVFRLRRRHVLDFWIVEAFRLGRGGPRGHPQTHKFHHLDRKGSLAKDDEFRPLLDGPVLAVEQSFEDKVTGGGDFGGADVVVKVARAKETFASTGSGMDRRHLRVFVSDIERIVDDKVL